MVIFLSVHHYIYKIKDIREWLLIILILEKTKGKF